MNKAEFIAKKVVRVLKSESRRELDPDDALLVARVDFIEFTLPIGSLIVFAIAAIIVGILAAIFPARRAARLNVLQALQYE
mgnify:CR=1 FL=1